MKNNYIAPLSVMHVYTLLDTVLKVIIQHMVYNILLGIYFSQKLTQYFDTVVKYK